MRFPILSLVAGVASVIAAPSEQAFFEVQNDVVNAHGLTDYVVGNYSLLGFHKQLVEIESISNHEHNVAVFLKEYLESLGLTVEVNAMKDEYEDRFNVYAYYGKTRNTKVLLTSHIDTVPPFKEYRVEGSKIYGRGSCDAKGSVASQVGAFLELLEEQSVQEGDLALLFVVGEEISGPGMKHALKTLGASWDVAIFGEPTELKLGVGHKGNYVFTLKAIGNAAHSGYPELGRSAAEILIPKLNELLYVKWPESELLGPSTLNIGTFGGGAALNVIPANAQANIYIRVAQDIKEIDRLVHEIVDDVPYLEYSLDAYSDEVYLDYEVEGFESIILAYGTDVPNLKVPLKKRYLYGPGSIHVAHSEGEYVENQDLIDAIRGYQKLVKHSLREL